MRRQWIFKTASGEPCRAAPLRNSEYCLMHSPEHAQEVQEARRLGGLRRKREATVSGAYDFEGLETVAGIRRLIEVAVIDTLGLENSLARSRTLAYLAMAALKCLEVGDFEQRLAQLEQAMKSSRISQAPVVFEIEPCSLDKNNKEES